jgi:hypothetical protein
MYCCVNCFQHEWLRDYIRENCTHEGECDFCGLDKTDLIDAGDLASFLHNTLDLYYPLQYGENYGAYDDPLDAGEPLIFLLQSDWQIFSEALDRAEDLLEEILNCGWDDDTGEAPVSANELYSRSKTFYDSSPAEDWQAFSEQIRDESNLEPVFSDALEATIWEHEKVIREANHYFRARPNWDREASAYERRPYVGVDILAPPPGKSKTGRVNVNGVSVLYVSEQEETAIAEIRPPRGSLVSVGDLCTNREMSILDLGDPIPAPNPFTTENLSYAVDEVNLLNAFSWTLSKPMERTDDESEYYASQKLSDWLKGLEFDGIRYPSQ